MRMKKFTLLTILAVFATMAVNAQIDGLTGLYTFADTDNLFANTATGGAGTGTMMCDGVMKFDPDATDTNLDDMASTELEDWSVVDGIHNKAISLKAFNWLKIWHGIAANGGGDYVNDFSVVMDVMFSCDTCVYSLLEVNPTPTKNGYGSEMEVDHLKLGSVDKPWSTDEIPYSTNTFEVDTWYRVIYSASLGTGIKMYVDGVEWNSWEGDITDGRPAPYSADAHADDAAMKVGGNNEQFPANNPQRDFDKVIDLVAIYNVTLTANDAALLGGPGAWLGVNDRDARNAVFSLYPNPASDVLYIDGQDLVQLEIISLSGQVVDRRMLDGESTVDISNLDRGMYLVKGYDRSGASAIQKLIVE